MIRKNYKERYEELYNIFQELLSDHRQVLKSLGELRAENEILMGILKKYGIEIPTKYADF
ncbi:hypothetical protein [Desulfotomaculum sp. 1211_IL3151]|uniref:hypothetical protein n=1 Tax=Desulfotomaculum sp. 1211_IL3151 TaxID=3084055 RepID=UPI002FD913BA